MATLAARLLAWPQYVLPQKLLTRIARKLSQCRIRWVSQALIGGFQPLFQVRLDEAELTDPGQYENFNAFFTRALRDGARPLADASHRLISPCDGTISELGSLSAGRLVQAKGIDYTAADLLGSPDWAEPFEGGRFVTIYLAPGDYHRVHMPIAGRLVAERRIPGRLFSVSAATTRAVPGLFTRNERLACRFETDQGPVAVVMVAALLVAGIETVWDGAERTRPGSEVQTRHPDGITLARGAEMGRFHWGSTVIVLTPPGFPAWREALAGGRRIRLGQALSEPEAPRSD